MTYDLISEPKYNFLSWLKTKITVELSTVKLMRAVGTKSIS
jgi:hypothetical protein